MSILWSNNASTTLTSSITAAQTTITVVDGSLFPTITGSDYFYITLGSLANGTEIAKCTARSGNTLTLQRGQEGTVAKAFSAGEFVELRVTAAGLLATGDRDTANYYAMVPADVDSTVYVQMGPTNTVGAINRVGQALLNKMTYALARIFPGFAGNQNKALFVNTSATGVEWRSLPEQYYVPIGGLVPFANQGLSFTDGPYTWLRSGVTTLASAYPNAPYRTVFTGDNITTHTMPTLANSAISAVAVSGNTVIVLPTQNTYNSGAYRSSDGGLTWEAVTMPYYPTVGVGQWSIGYVNPTSLFFVCPNGSNGVKVYESADNGNTWVERSYAGAANASVIIASNKIFTLGGRGYLLLNTGVVLKLTPGAAVSALYFPYVPSSNSGPVYSWTDGTTVNIVSRVIDNYENVRLHLVSTTDFLSFAQKDIPVPTNSYFTATPQLGNTLSTGLYLSTGEVLSADGSLVTIKAPSTSQAFTSGTMVDSSFVGTFSNRLYISQDMSIPPTICSSTTSINNIGQAVIKTPAAGLVFLQNGTYYRTLTTNNYVDNMTISFSDSPQNNKPFYMRVA